MAARAAKEKKEEEEKAVRAALMDRRTKAYDDVNKRLHPQLERLKTDADEIKDQLTKLDLEKKTYSDEQAFLLTFVRQAEANVKTYYSLLDQLAAAEKARADAEVAAAKKKS
jgi:DNA repair exonuclease SbcCD ATPase subunit